MTLTNKDFRRIFVAFLMVILVVVAFLIIKPIVLSIIGGLILSYMFLPVYRWTYKLIKGRNTTAILITLLFLIIVFVPLWFLIPIVVDQVFELFNLTQNIDFSKIVQVVFPSSGEQFQQHMTVVIIKFVGNISSSIIDYLISFIQNLPTVLLNMAVILFVFFFALRDQEVLKEFVSGISPFKKEKESILVKRFKDITSSIIFGYVIVGALQGLMLGIGLLIFGVPKALTIALFGTFAAMLPMVGPWLVWIPVAIFMFANSSFGIALLFTIYCTIFVSAADNILRPLIIARKTGTSSVIVLVGMIGGLYVFKIIGLILGPLILSYLILFLKAYKDGTLSDMFSPAE